MLSVIIPNYNHAPYLKQRIESILSQTWHDFEIIILDDCSTDNSRQVIENYRNHPKVSKVLYSETNGGIAFKQWQKGIELAKGEWVWIAESDDWCENNFLETLINGIKSTTAIAVAQSVVISFKGKILWESHADYLERSIAGTDFVNNKMLLDNFGIPNASMCIFKKNLYFNIDKEFTSYKFCGDLLFWILIALQGEVFVSGKYLNYFRKHDKDVSGPAYRNGLHYLEYFQLLESLMKRGVIHEEQCQQLLLGKLKMFLQDQRLDSATQHRVTKEFKQRIEKKYYQTVLKFKTIQFLKSLNH